MAREAMASEEFRSSSSISRNAASSGFSRSMVPSQ